MVWAALRVMATVTPKSRMLGLSMPLHASDTGNVMTEQEAAAAAESYVAGHLHGSALVRIGTNDADAEAQLASVSGDTATLTADWPGSAVTKVHLTVMHIDMATLTVHWPGSADTKGAIWKHAVASRKQPYIELLLASEREKRVTGGGGSSSGGIHTAGFQTVYKAMAGDEVHCPICLGSVVRPCVTMCVHVYCRECIGAELDIRLHQPTHVPKCPLCRRDVNPGDVCELQLDTTEEDPDAQQHDSAQQHNRAREDDDHAPSAAAKPYKGKGKGKARASPGGGAAANGTPKGKGKGKGRASPKPASSLRQSRRAAADGKRRGNSGGGGGGGGGGSAGGGGGSSGGGGGGGSSGGGSANGGAAIGTGSSVTLPDLSRAWRAPLGDTDLQAIPPPPGAPLHLRDPSAPSLDPLFLAHWRAASAAGAVGAKLRALIGDMRAVLRREPAAKFVVFSAAAEALAKAAEELNRATLKCVTISGAVSVARRGAAVTEFNTDPSVRVVLLAMGSAAAGLTLTAASTVYMLEPAFNAADEAQLEPTFNAADEAQPTFNAADEAQALSRAHRIGQTHSVRCVIFYCAGTLEERLLALRHESGGLASLLSGSGALTGLAEDSAEVSHLLSLPNLQRLLGVTDSQLRRRAAGSNDDGSSEDEESADDDY
ncbi:hypothetical protein JKP88DRAFT_348976 [Tribonema minus]|uniref:Uncharacterized protein n=1 Tax=Tribonema minus TaxID=303371 RepID=A0A835YV89_9STRA|nr:hypothetical protein JKP88DRAFT_348976 [Tribonema minus]